MQNAKAKHKYRWDILIIALLASVGLVLALVLLLMGKHGGQVQVRVDGDVVMEYALDRDRTVEIKGYQGGTNLLVIENGAACIREASCPDHLCVNMGWIDKTGQTVVCLPNRLVVEITRGMGADGESDVDIVT